MTTTNPIILAWGMEIIPIFDVPFFIKSQYQKWEILFWYEFFIIIPWEVTLPVSDLFFEIQDVKMNSLERTWLALLELLDIENIKEVFKVHLKSFDTPEKIDNFKDQEPVIEEYKYWYQEWIKYMEWKESKVIVGCELMY